MLKPQPVNFFELTRMLQEFEHKYGYSTIEFYRRFMAGELGDDEEMMLWAGLYHLYLTTEPIRQFACKEPVPA